MVKILCRIVKLTLNYLKKKDCSLDFKELEYGHKGMRRTNQEEF